MSEKPDIHAQVQMRNVDAEQAAWGVVKFMLGPHDDSMDLNSMVITFETAEQANLIMGRAKKLLEQAQEHLDTVSVKWPPTQVKQ